MRQFDDGDSGPRFEVSGLNYTQRVEVRPHGHRRGYPGPHLQALRRHRDRGQGDPLRRLARNVAFQADGGNAVRRPEVPPAVRTSTTTPQLVTSRLHRPASPPTGGPDDDASPPVTATTAVSGGVGNDALDTGLGDDQVTGAATATTPSTAAPARDDIAAATDNDRLQGGPGADRVDRRDRQRLLVGGTGRDIRAVLVAEPRGTSPRRRPPPGPPRASTAATCWSADRESTTSTAATAPTWSSAAPPRRSRRGTIARQMTTTTPHREHARQGPPPTRRASPVVVPTAKVPGPAAARRPLRRRAPSSVRGRRTGLRDRWPRDGRRSSAATAPTSLDGGAGPDEMCGRHGDDQLSGDAARPSPAATRPNDVDVLRGGPATTRSTPAPAAPTWRTATT